MRIGAMFNTEVAFDQMIGEVASLRDAGIQTAWASQIFAYDALTAIAAAINPTSEVRAETASLSEVGGGIKAKAPARGCKEG